MGTNCDSASFDNKIGIIPRAIRHLFLTMSSRKEEAKKSGNSEPIFDVSVQFVEACIFTFLLTNWFFRYTTRR
jgi:hypothetical protein